MKVNQQAGLTPTTVASDSSQNINDILGKVKNHQELSPSDMQALQSHISGMIASGKEPSEEFVGLLNELGMDFDGAESAVGQAASGNSSASSASSASRTDMPAVGSAEYEGMSIQEKIFALMLSAIDSQEKSLEQRFEMIASQKDKVDTLNKANAALGDLAGQLDPADPEDTIDITQTTIQIADPETGTMRDVNAAQYLKDAGYTFTDPTKMNATGLSSLQSAVKDGTESLNATSQTDLLKLQTESSKLSRLYEITTNMMKTMSDSAQGIARNLT